MIKIQLPRPHIGQQKIIDGYNYDPILKYATVPCGRQWGKSFYGKFSMMDWLLTDKGAIGGWITPYSKQATKVFKEIKDEFQGVITKSNSIEGYIEFVNGSKLNFLSAESYTSIRGYTFDYVVVDEAAFIRDEAWSVMIPTWSIKAKKVVFISTPNGKNKFYGYYQKGLEEDPRWCSYHAMTGDNPYFPQDDLREAKVLLPKALYEQEYEGAFVETGGEVFVGIDRNAILTKWEDPNPLMRYVFSIDTAVKSDKSVLAIGNLSTNTIAYIKTSYEQNYPDIFAEFIAELSKWNISGGYIETNGIGQAMFDTVSRQYPKAEGFVMSQKSKQEIVTLSRTMLQQGLIKIPSKELYPSLFNQLSDYEVRVSSNGLHSYSHPKGGNDDDVDAFTMLMKAMRDFQYGGQKIMGRGNRRRR